jgi:predicted transcriptional regulator
MNFKKYIDNKKLTASAFAKKNNLPTTTAWRAYNGKPMRLSTALMFHRKTKLPLMVFLYPEKYFQ